MISRPDTVNLARGPIEVWPSNTAIHDWADPNVKVVLFDDIERYHPALRNRVLSLETDASLGRRIAGFAGSAKVYHLHKWSCPEADLIQLRALELFKRVLGKSRATVDLGWANIYRSGDYCLPHSHVRATASLVYFLDLGFGGADAPMGAGHGRFCFADPRMTVCCREEPHAMTTPSGPTTKEGMLIMFPGKLVHMVDTFLDTGPRITLSWNINETALPGSPLPG